MNFKSEADYHKILSWAFREKAEVQKVVELYGSNFDKILVQLFRAADDAHSFKLLAVFENEFRKYFEFHQQQKENSK